ncbi:MAG TPA: DinB family protein [Gemmatimonadaceae bacterium]
MTNIEAPDAPRLAARLADQATGIPSLLAGCDPSDLERRSPTGGWSAREHLAHLARYHEVFLARLDRMLSEEAPRLDRYRAESDPEFQPFLALSVGEVRARFDALRAALIARVSRLTPSELARTGVHPAFGEMPVALWLEFFLAHEGHHMYVMLQRARDRGRGATAPGGA